ncbi:MAG: hypothetical protein ACRD68_03545, partial [Pyrinomonadaceae bacterium]
MSQAKAETDFKKLTLERLRGRAQELRREWSAREPFRYVIVDDFLPGDFAEKILAAYPEPEVAGWDDTTYIH